LNYQETVDYLFGMLPMYQRVGAQAYKKDLDNTLALLEALDNPHKKLKCIHIAGTNGKGSVSHMIASALQEAGYKTALYISPHYKDYRERIKINGEYISEEYVIAFVAKMKEHIERISPSFFEMTVAMAFDYFVYMQVDYAVIETGLGGRLDSTNVIEPLLSVITNISYDHMNMLGDTLPLIAKEKAGIIKYKKPVVIGETQEEVKKVFTNKVYETNSIIYFADKEVSIDNIVITNIGACTLDIDIKNNTDIKNVEIDFYASYQLKNIITAVSALEILRKNNIAISDVHIKAGLEHLRKNTAFVGRWTVLQKNPTVIIDSAHNEAGITEILQQLKSIKYTHLHWVYGSVNDKDLSKIINLLPKKDTTYYLCKPNIPRGLDEEILLDFFTKENYLAKSYTSVASAYEGAKSSCTSSEIIIISGSIFVIAEVL
jgi:dihydrofolate synthase/folylpolyglutamate synthase